MAECYVIHLLSVKYWQYLFFNDKEVLYVVKFYVKQTLPVFFFLGYFLWNIVAQNLQPITTNLADFLEIRANSILHKFTETVDLVLEHDIDILILCPCNTFKITNYTKGGTAIAIKNFIPHLLPDPVALQHTESTTIILSNTQNQRLQLSFIYIPPSKPFHAPDFFQLQPSS